MTTEEKKMFDMFMKELNANPVVTTTLLVNPQISIQHAGFKKKIEELTQPQLKMLMLNLIVLSTIAIPQLDMSNEHPHKWIFRTTAGLLTNLGDAIERSLSNG